MANPSDKVLVLGQELVPESGVLIVPNYLSFRDLLQLEKLLAPRKITYLVESDAIIDPLLQAHLERDNVTAREFASQPQDAEEFKRLMHTTVAVGDLLVFVPGQATTRTGSPTSVPSVTLRFLMATGAPVMPLFVDHPEEARLAIESVGQTERIAMAFGKPMEREAANLANYQENLLVAGQKVFSARPALEMNLAYALLLGLKKHGSNCQVFDGFRGDATGFDKLMAAAIVFSKYLKQRTTAKRVGIILPPGTGGLMANLAVLFAGKVPVNLNFTAGRDAIQYSMDQAELDCFVTAGAFKTKMDSFPWPDDEQLVLMDKLLPELKKKIAVWYILGKVIPAGMLANILGIPQKGGDEEAVLLFTSGSSGQPKGVMLSHRNMIANVNQFSSRLQLKAEDSALGCLPLFHSFGCTVTMWYPVIEGINLVTYPSPMEFGKLAELIEQHKISLFVATPTFLRGYMRKATPEQLQSLKLVVTGAEKLPPSVAQQFEKKFGKPVMEGYGLTETSPATNVNLPDLEPFHDGEPVLPSRRPGSVGQLLPGVAVRITDPDTDQPQSLHQTGMIWLSGPNIFMGYLKQPEKTSEMLIGNWLRTGDIGRYDEDGFLYIEGRLSRFSKVAGEMVPHETLEEAINKQLGLEGDDRKVVVTGIPDEAKGEKLILITTLKSLNMDDLRLQLLESGIASLWIPKTVIQIGEIPHLASGKLDLKRCLDIAKNGGEEEVEPS